MLISIFLMIMISTSLTVPTQPSPRFHVEAWLPFRNCEKDYCFTNQPHEEEANIFTSQLRPFSKLLRSVHTGDADADERV